MKKQHVYILGIVGILIVLSLSGYFIFRGLSNISGSSLGSIPKNDPKVEERVQLVQNQLYPSFFSTVEDTKNDMLNVHLVLNPNVNWYVRDTVTEFEISNVSTDFKIGTPIRVFPSHFKSDDNCYSYMYTDCDDQLKASDYKETGKRFSYALVDGGAVYRDEVTENSNLLPNFRVVLKNLATISAQTILNRDKIFDGDKLDQYAGLTGEQLSGTMSFDVKFVFENGDVFRKRYTATIDGEKLKTEDFYNAPFVPAN